MRRILFEIPSAQTIAWIVAVIAVLFALYHALRKPGKTESGEREPFPLGSVAGGLAVAAVLVWGVALNHDAFREDVVVLKDGKEVHGKIVKESDKTVQVAVFGRAKPIFRSDIKEIVRNETKGIPIYSYGFMMMAAFATAIYVASVRARKAGIDPNLILDLGLWCMISGILGARLFYVIQFSEQFEGRAFWEYFKVWEGGIVFYGGAIGSFLAGAYFVISKKVELRRVLDVIAPSIPLGVAFARFGCFLNGC